MSSLRRRTLRFLTVLVAASALFTSADLPSASAASRSPLLILGDSLCVGADRHADMTGRLRSAGWEPTVRCLGSQRMSWGIDQVRTMPHVPPTVVVALGTNGGRVEPGFDATLTTMRSELVRRGARRIVWVNYADRNDGYAAKNQTLSWFADRHGDRVADWAAMARADHSLFQVDGLHHSGPGAAAWVGLIRDTLVASDPVVGVAHAPTGSWSVTSSGRVTANAGASHHGDMSSLRLNAPVIAISGTASGNGYWLVAADGGIFSFGDASFHGSTGHLRLNQPVVGMAPTPDGRGYWLVARDGGIFSFGNASFHGSTGHLRLNQPVLGMARPASGQGYWLVAADGGVFAFGAPFHGSLGGQPKAYPVVGIVGRGQGYALVDAGGQVHPFGPPGTSASP